ncbi:MAG: hypothetical protein ACRELF_21950, partial [Gemmataceae bacterium]
VLGKAHVSICLPRSPREEAAITELKSGESGDLFQLSHSLLTRLQAPANRKSVASKVRGASTP